MNDNPNKTVDEAVEQIEKTIGSLDVKRFERENFPPPPMPPLPARRNPNPPARAFKPQEMAGGDRLGPLAAEAMLKEVHAATEQVKELATTLDEEVHVMVSTVTADIDGLIERTRELSELISRARQGVRDTSNAYGSFGKRLSAQIAVAGELCRRVSAQCETLKREVNGSSLGEEKNAGV